MPVHFAIAFTGSVYHRSGSERSEVSDDPWKELPSPPPQSRPFP